MIKKTFYKTKILTLIFALSGVLTLSAKSNNILKVSAEENDNAVAMVNNVKYDNYVAAWNAVSAGGTINMLKDWTTSSPLTVKENVSISINMNGFMINRNLFEATKAGNIFTVSEGATLFLNGNGVTSTTHYGNFINNKWTYQSGKGNIPINGSLLTGGFSKYGGGAIHVEDNGYVNIDGVDIVGNACGTSGYGGAIYVEGDEVDFRIRNSSISYNRSEETEGGAFYIEGSDGSIFIYRCDINYNVADGESEDGGAIYVEDSRVALYETNVSYNRAGGCGGAIYAYGGDIYTDTTNFTHNSCGEYGGAIYMDDSSRFELSGKLIGNQALIEGGAVYVNSNINNHEGAYFVDVEIYGNSALINGGGIFVDSDDDISLESKVEVYQNTPNNLYIEDEEAIHTNNLSEGSRIGIKTSWLDSVDDPIETTNYKYFFSDKLNHVIVPCEDGFYTAMHIVSNKTKYVVDNVAYPLEEGTFGYTYDMDNIFVSNYFYSDGYFAKHPRYYNEHLSTFSLSLAMATFMSYYQDDNYSEEKGAENAINMFASMNYEDVYIHYPNPKYYGEDAENLSTIGYLIAKKETTINGKPTTIIATTIRGGGYGEEWSSNFNLGDGTGEAKGFSDGARQVKQGIDNYIKNHEINTENVKFLVTGFSRSAAVANLLSKRLSDIYGEEKVYGYCFATPKGGRISEIKEGHLYTNIHNIINKSDMVPGVGPSEMGFIRYGIDHYIPGSLVGTDDYNEKKVIMLNHLKTFNKNLVFDDYFHEATLEYIASSIDVFNIIFDLIDENYFTDYDYAEHWIPFLFGKLQEYSFNDMLTDVELTSNDRLKEPYKNYNADNEYNKNSNKFLGYRNFYSNYKWYIYLDGSTINNKSYDIQPADFSTDKYTVLTLEKALGNIIGFYFGASSEKINKFTEALDLDDILNKINKTDIYFDIIRNWRNLKIEERNGEFNKLWSQLGIDKTLKDVVTDEEFKMIRTSLYVVFDFLLDFVSEDYDETDQDVLGTLLHNVENITSNHNTEVTYAWVKSYDSFFTAGNHQCSHYFASPTIVKEASETEYGVKKFECLICGEEKYETIPMIKSESSDKGVASLIGTGSIISIICMSVALVGTGVSIYFYAKTKKAKNIS